jgi:hypothetical protein
MRCVDCNGPCDSIGRVCPPCITKRVDESRTVQGLPLEPSDETMERVARLLRPAAARGVA